MEVDRKLPLHFYQMIISDTIKYLELFRVNTDPEFLLFFVRRS